MRSNTLSCLFQKLIVKLFLHQPSHADKEHLTILQKNSEAEWYAFLNFFDTTITFEQNRRDYCFSGCCFIPESPIHTFQVLRRYLSLQNIYKKIAS